MQLAIRACGVRPPAESLNRWIKERLRDRRAPAVGAARQQFALLGAALYNNLRAAIAHDDRIGVRRAVA